MENVLNHCGIEKYKNLKSLVRYDFNSNLPDCCKVAGYFFLINSGA